MTFTEAIAGLLAGGKVRRKSWRLTHCWRLPKSLAIMDPKGLFPCIYREDIEAQDWEEVAA